MFNYLIIIEITVPFPRHTELNMYTNIGVNLQTTKVYEYFLDYQLIIEDPFHVLLLAGQGRFRRAASGSHAAPATQYAAAIIFIPYFTPDYPFQQNSVEHLFKIKKLVFSITVNDSNLHIIFQFNNLSG